MIVSYSIRSLKILSFLFILQMECSTVDLAIFVKIWSMDLNNKQNYIYVVYVSDQSKETRD